LVIGKQINYDKFYLYLLITHSTAIEGSTVTEIENQLLFDEGISAKGRSITEQLMNLDLKAAYEQCIALTKSHTDISIDVLKKLSALVLKNTGNIYKTALGDFSSANGDIRLLNVTAGVGGRSYMNYAKVPMKLAEFCKSLNSKRNLLSQSDILDCYKLSFDAHYQLVTIHPWADGNGRMPRLLMNQLQIEFGVIPTNINKDRKAEHIEALIATHESDDLELFRNFMLDEHIRNMEQMIHNYQTSIDKDNINIEENVPVNLIKREKQILKLMKINSTITIHELSEIFELNEKTIRRDLAFLRNQHLLVRIGANKNGKWIVMNDSSIRL